MFSRALARAEEKAESWRRQGSRHGTDRGSCRGIGTVYRNRIYSLLSLADDIYGPSTEGGERASKKSQGRLRIAPDYGIDPGTVYRSFAEYLIRHQSHLDLLQCAGAFSTTADSGHPSWAPEWTQEMQYTPFLDVPWFTAGPKKASISEPKASTCYPWCFVNGVIVDSIAMILPRLGESVMPKTGLKDLSEFEDILEEFPIFLSYPTGERLWQVLALTFVADHALNHRLRTRFAGPHDGWYDGHLMKRDARERDTQVLLDWFLTTRDEEAKETFRSGLLVMHTFEDGHVDDILQRCKKLSSTVHHAIVTSAHIKTMETRNDWDETSSTSRSGWHPAGDLTDLPYMVARMMKEVVKNEEKAADDEASSNKRNTTEKRTKDLHDIKALIQALQASDGNASGEEADLEGTKATDQLLPGHGGTVKLKAGSRPSTLGSSRPFRGLETEDTITGEILIGSEPFHTVTNPDEDEIENEDEEDSEVERTEDEDEEAPSDESDDEVEELPEATKSQMPQLDQEFMASHPELMAEHMATMTQMLALMSVGNTAGLVTLMETVLRRAQGDLAHFSTKIFGHATPEVLREHGLGRVADAIDEFNTGSEPLNQQAEGDTSDDSDFGDGSTDQDNEVEDDEDEEAAEPGEYERLGAIGDLRGDEDGFLWFQPDEQNTQVYAELAHRTMQGRQLFFTTLGYVGIAPTAVKVGDSVAVFRGGRTPFIIRKHTDSAAYQLIGDSYVHGLMRGEAFDLDGVEEREFVLL